MAVAHTYYAPRIHPVPTTTTTTAAAALLQMPHTTRKLAKGDKDPSKYEKKEEQEEEEEEEEVGENSNEAPGILCIAARGGKETGASNSLQLTRPAHAAKAHLGGVLAQGIRARVHTHHHLHVPGRQLGPSHVLGAKDVPTSVGCVRGGREALA